MGACYIQLLEQVKDGWHIRFGGPGDEFWTMLSNFKREYACQYNSRYFKNKGGWFCPDAVLVKYSSEFSNYAEMRREANYQYEQSGKAEEDRRAKEAEEAKREEAKKSGKI